MKYTPKLIPEGINVTPQHPLIDFGYLIATIVLISALIFFSLGWIAEWLAIKISPTTETKIGQILISSTMPALSSSVLLADPRLDYLQKNLLPALAGETQPPLTVHLFDDDIINAAILPGGHILVWTGLLKAVQSENELAFVLAHEVAHFKHRDPLRILGRSLVMLSLLTMLGIGNNQSLAGLPSLVSQTGELIGLQYSRQQEQAADEEALSSVIQHYGHGGQALDFFKRLAEQEPQWGGGLKISRYFSTHPPTVERLARLTQLAKVRGWTMTGAITPLPRW